MNTNNKKAPDYGEPWKVEKSESELWVSATNWTRDPGDIACEIGDDNPVSLQHWPVRAERIVQCVNACAGMADPAAELQAMRKAIGILQKIVGMADRLACGENYRIGKRAKAALAKLQPFIK